MDKYQNKNGNSGIIMHEIHENYIDVKFSDGSIYRYSYIRPGKLIVDYMKSLAIQGCGLNSYINRSVGKNFYCKIR